MQKITLLCLLLCSLYMSSANAVDIDDRPELRGFIDEMVKQHGFDRAELTRLFTQTEVKPAIIEAIRSPAEKKSWRDYRPIFVNPARIRAGVEFWNTHAQVIARAESVYGVAPEIIVAIIGVETRYGKNTGGYRVLDALTTLAFDYPERSTFFRSELEHYLLLAREEHLDPTVPKGSYAGAMGVPQFISSSYRRYAVDFDNDGRRDLWSDIDDVIGSVANYLSVFGWQPGAPVAGRARVSGEKFNLLIDEGLKPELSLDQLQHYGISLDEAEPPPASRAGAARGALIALEGDDGTEYWVGMQNFYAITRYNNSAMYAMAVYQLSQEIRAQKQSQVSSDK
ncbi:MAG: lytic murein transglycosylase B [Gammaproteobacteria bacterium]|nr:lytic murein transglycosylase B [Gammaproteobacteria bacterium]